MESERNRSANKLDVVYFVMLATLLVVALFFMGKPRVGTIDLGRVASELGVEQSVVEDAQKWREAAMDDFKRLRDEYQLLGKGVQSKAAEAQTEEEKLALRKAMTEATRAYYESSAEVRERVRKHEQQVLRTFRERLDPFVREVARHRRLWLVLDRSARLVYSTTQIDITDDVIRRAAHSFETMTGLVDSDPSEEDLPKSLIEPDGDDE